MNYNIMEVIGNGGKEIGMFSILLVEDEKIELETLKNYVDWKGCGIDEIYTARGGRSALECIASKEPDIAILDIQMPGMTGIQLAEIIRQEGYQCKIIFLTGYDKFEYAKEAVKLQAVDFLLKPFQIDEVESLVRKTIEKIEKERTAAKVRHRARGEFLQKSCMGNISDALLMSGFYFQKPAEEVLFYMMSLKGLTDSEGRLLAERFEVQHIFKEGDIWILLLSEMITPLTFRKKLKEILGHLSVTGAYVEERLNLIQLQSGYERLRSCRQDLNYLSVGSMMNCKDHKSGEEDLRLQKTKGNTGRWASFVQEFVARHYMEDCTVEEMAEILQVSPNYLRRKFKEEMDMTILEYITEYRLIEAEELLYDKKCKIKEVSIAVGYPNISYFTQLFAKKYGVTPNEYKKTL